MDEPRDPGRCGGLEEPARPPNVRLVELFGHPPVLNVGRAVEDPSDALRRPVQRGAVAEVADGDLRAVGDVRLEAAFAAGPAKDTDGLPALEEPLGEVAPDEPCRARNGIGHRGIVQQWRSSSPGGHGELGGERHAKRSPPRSRGAARQQSCCPEHRTVVRVVITTMRQLLPEFRHVIAELTRRFDSISVLFPVEIPPSPWLTRCSIEGLELGSWSSKQSVTELQHRIDGAHALIHVPANRTGSPEGQAMWKPAACIAEAMSRLRRQPWTFLSLTSTESEQQDMCGEVGSSITDFARSANIRLCVARIGLVLHAPRGAFTRALCALRMQGAYGPPVDGSIYWIHVLDAARAIAHVLDTVSLAGAVDVIAPEPIPSDRFAAAVWAAYGFPSGARRAASTVGRLLAPLESGCRRSGQAYRLVDSGFSYLFPDFPSALTDIADRGEA